MESFDIQLLGLSDIITTEIAKRLEWIPDESNPPSSVFFKPGSKAHVNYHGLIIF